MTHLTAYLIACPLLLWALWLRYVTVMHFMKVRRAGRLTKPALVLGFLPSIAGVVLDVFVNFAYGYLLTLTLPRWGEWTVTAHLQRLYADREKWAQMSLKNTANSGIFSADRSVLDYARDIWGATPVK